MLENQIDYDERETKEMSYRTGLVVHTESVNQSKSAGQ